MFFFFLGCWSGLGGFGVLGSAKRDWLDFWENFGVSGSYALGFWGLREATGVS